MATLKTFNKLPGIFRTDTQKRFFLATFEQLFSKKNVEDITAYIGRRVPGRHDPINDYYLAEPTKERTWYQLEATSYSVDSTTLDQTNIMFYQDLLNRLNYYGANTKNNDTLFSGGYYSFGPPIDLDKFINFQNYYWIEDRLPVIMLTVENESGINADEWIINNIIGKKNASITLENGNTIQLSNGLRIQYTNSSSFNRPLTVEGVGKGIILVKDESHLVDTVGSVDYITIERGCRDGNAWSRTNKWYHKSVMATSASATNTSTYNNAVKARRPIIEFDRDIELFKSGNNYLGEVNLVAESDNISSISNSASYTIDGKLLEDQDKLIFLSNSTITYPIVDTFIADTAPYNIILRKPFTDTDDIFVIVKRGNKMFYNPEWYSYEDELNQMNFIADTKGLQWNPISYDINNVSFENITNGIEYKFYTPSSVGTIKTIDVVNRGTSIRQPRTSFTFNVETLNTPVGKNNSIVTITGTTLPTNLAFDVIINDNIDGLLPGDQVEINVNNKVNMYKKPAAEAIEGPGARRTFLFNNDFTFNFTQQNIGNHIIGIQIDAYTRDANNDPVSYDYLYNPADDFVSFTIEQDNALLVEFKNIVPDDSIVKLIVRDNETLTLNATDYIWKIVKVEQPDNTVVNSIIPVPNKYTKVAKGDVVLVTEGDTFAGDMFYYTGVQWERTYNRKTNANQAPLFNLYYTDLDSNNNAISLDSFPQSTFAGSKIFSYKVNEESAYDDEILGFPIEVKNLGQISDIVFRHDLHMDVFQYFNGNEFEPIKGYYYFKQWNYTISGSNPTYEHTWVPFDGNSKQRVIDRFVVSDSSQKEYELSVTPEELETGIFDIRVEYNKSTLAQNVEFTIVLDNDGKPTKTIKILRSLSATDVIQTYTYSKEALPDNALGYYQIPQQLENNPNNLEVNEYSSNELTNHFVSIMTNQIGFKGDPYSSNNNYRDTAEDKSLGTFILQNRSPLLKTMLVSSSEELNINSAIRFARDEYTRYKDKFIKYAKELIVTPLNQNTNPVNIDALFTYVINRVTSTFEYNGAFTQSYMAAWGDVYDEYNFSSTLVGNTLLVPTNNILDKMDSSVLVFRRTGTSVDYNTLTIDKDYTLSYSNNNLVVKLSSTPSNTSYIVRIYNNILSAKIPATPSKIGCYPVYQPKIIVDNSYVTPTEVILGHDGSKIPTYGDIRDDLLLEFETRIYNNIADKFRLDYNLLLKLDDVKPTKFYENGYTLQQYNEIVKPYFLKWCLKNSLNYKLYSGFNSLNWKTWNYRPVSNDSIGSWRGLYKYYYNTLTPNKTPWEMLGFVEKPTWWDEEYNGDYTSQNTDMWTDIENGIIRRGNRAGTHEKYKRTGLVPNLIPSDASGDLKTPEELGIVPQLSNQEIETLQDEWIFGDNSPVEEAWYTNSEWPFVQLELLYLMKPADFGERYWNPLDDTRAPINAKQYISSSTYTRIANSNTYAHGEVVNGNIVLNSGYQQYVFDRLSFMGKQDITYNFGSKIRSLDVCLAHRLAGYTNVDTLNVYADSISGGSTNSSMLLPNENIHVRVYTGKPITEYVFSGVAIRVNEYGKFEVRGYDVLNPVFKVVPRSTLVSGTTINVGGTTSNFTIYDTNVQYNYGDVVRYNGVYYQCVVIASQGKFNQDNWMRLKSLPATGGITVNYINEGDYSEFYEIEYGSELDTPQDVFDFLIGYGQYLELNGWKFNEIDQTTGEVLNWVTSAKGFLFWATTQWAPNNTLFVAPGASKITLEVNEGYPEKVERISNGVYSILDQNGYAISPNDTIIDRDRRTISVSHESDQIGIYLFRVSTSDTEHAILFDNKTIFNDTIYDPLLYSRQKRLQLRGIRTNDWYGKFEADGYLIQDDNLLQNFENLTDSIWHYYDTENTLDNPIIEQTARHLIGFQDREYLNNLRITGDQQYLFYKGMISQKGTKQSVDKLLRSEFIKSNENIQIYEEFAFKLADFGATNSNAQLEVLIDGDLVKSDPQIVELSYPVSYGTGKVSEVRVLSSEMIYTTTPIIVFATPEEANAGLDPNVDAYLQGNQLNSPNNNIVEEIRATGQVVLKNGRIDSVTITEPGYGYIKPPKIAIIYNQTVITIDKLISIIKNKIDEDSPYDMIITIDSDDNERWLSKPNGRMPVIVGNEIKYNDRLVPTTKQLDGNIPTAGYVNSKDVTHQILYPKNIFTLWERKDVSKPSLTSYIWVGNASSVGIDWGVFVIYSGLTPATNALYPYCIINNIVYSYTVDSDGVIDAIFDKEGKQVTNVPIQNPLFFKNVRFKNNASVNVTSGKVWIDSINSDNDWAVAVVSGSTITNIRSRQNLVDSKLFENAYFYDKDTKQTIDFLPVYDPVKGLIPGTADRNIHYKSEIDPTTYSVSANSANIDDELAFTDSEVGRLWWDTSTCRYLQYEQPGKLDGSETKEQILEYRRDNWGKLFPGSVINVYEWVSSPFTPDLYNGTGTPKSLTDYVVRYDTNSAGQATPIYYYWVKGKQEIPNNIKSRNMTSTSVENLITNPKSQGYKWFSFIGNNSFVFSNVSKTINGKTPVFQVNYRYTKNINEKHTEWKLLREGDEVSVIPTYLWNRLVDSLVGYNINGDIVPDPTLSEFSKLGIKVRPRQSMIDNRMAARKVFVQNANSLLSTISIKDFNPAWADGLASSVLWRYVNWYADGFNQFNTTPVKQVSTVGELTGLVGKLKDGDIVKLVRPEEFTLYQYSNQNFTLIGRQNSAIQLLPAIYTVSRSYTNDNALRELIFALYNNVFKDANLVMRNLVFFALINYILSEQQNLDWVFKTTYIKVNQEGESLTQQESVTTDPIQSFISYIKEIKPYTTKIRDLGVKYNVPMDIANGTAYDYDSLYDWPDDHEGEQAPFRPIEVPRLFDINSLYDRVQCGYITKPNYIDLGDQTFIGTGGQVVLIANTPNDEFIALDGISQYHLGANKDISRITSVTINGQEIEGYTFTTILNATFIILPSTPDAGDVIIVNYTDIKSVWKIKVDGKTITKEQYDVEINENGYLQVTFKSNTLIKIGSKIKLYSGTEFTQTPLEEMRLEYNARQPGKVLKPIFDLAIDPAGKIAGGWGIPKWGQLRWGIPGTIQEGNRQLWTEYLQYSGAAGRYILYQTDLQRDILSAAPINGSYPYSSFTERLYESSAGERDVLFQFNERFGDEYGCDYEGKVIDAKDFEYIFSRPWDSTKWDEYAWDASTATYVITPNYTETSATVISEGKTTFVIRYVVDITGVTLNGSSTQYTATKGSNFTSIEVPSAAEGDEIVFTFNPVTNTFNSDTSKPIIDGAYFEDTNVREGIPEEQALVSPTENMVIIVDSNAKTTEVQYVVTNTDTSNPFVKIVLTEKIVLQDIIGLVINGDPNTKDKLKFNIDNNGINTVVIAYPTSFSTGDIISVVYKDNYTSQTTVANDYRFDTNSVVRDNTQGYITVDLRNTKQNKDINTWDTFAWDPSIDSPENADSVYLLPIDMPTIANPDEVVAQASGQLTYKFVDITANGVDTMIHTGMNILPNRVQGVYSSGVAMYGYTVVVDNSGITPELVINFEIAPSAGTVITVKYQSYSIMKLDDYVSYVMNKYNITSVTTSEYKLQTIDMFVAANKRMISVSNNLYTRKSKEMLYTNTKLFTVDTSIRNFVGETVYINGISKTKDKDYTIEFTNITGDNAKLLVVYKGTLNAGDIIRIDWTETNIQKVTDIVNNSWVAVFNEQHNFINPVTMQGDNVVIKYPAKPLSFRVHLDEMGETHYVRISDYYSTRLAKPLKLTDKSIELVDASAIVDPSSSKPGVVWIGTERIEFLYKRGNKLHGLTRGSLGTSVYTGTNGDTSVPLYTRVFDGSYKQEQEDTGKYIWENNNGGLALSTTPWAIFLQNRPGSGLTP